HSDQREDKKRSSHARKVHKSRSDRAARSGPVRQDITATQSISRVIFNSTPMPARVIKIEVPPEEINGSGIPFVGSSASTTLILKNAWIKIAVVNPHARNAP